MSHGATFGNAAPPAMQRTRTEEAERLEKERVRKKAWRDNRTAAKRLADNKKRRLSGQMKREAIAATKTNLKKKLHTAQGHVKRLLESNAELQEELKKRLEEDALDEEPIVTDVDVKNIEEAYAYARAAPRDFETLTGETLESFDELYRLAGDALRARTWRGTDRERAAAHAPRVSDELQLFICLIFLRQYPTYTFFRFALRALDDLTLSKYIHRVLRALEDLKELAIK